MIIKKKKQSVLLSVENLTVCDFFSLYFFTIVVYRFFLLLLLFVCGSLLSHKMSKELHDNKEKTTGTSLF